MVFMKKKSMENSLLKKNFVVFGNLKVVFN